MRQRVARPWARVQALTTFVALCTYHTACMGLPAPPEQLPANPDALLERAALAFRTAGTYRFESSVAVGAAGEPALMSAV